jgi:very-short-patch-repair endonuclease
VHVIGARPADLRARATALLPLLREGDAFSHSTAAILLGAPLPPGHDRVIHVTSRERNRIRRPDIRGHRAANVDSTLIAGLPVVVPAAAWFHLAMLLRHDDLVAVGDFLVTPQRRGIKRSPAIASIADLSDVISGRGAARARRALADVRVGAESRMETLTRLHLIRAGLPEPELNPELRIAGRTLHPDLLFREWSLVLEYEGDGHRTDPHAWRRDIWRREAFQEAGFRVIQVHAEDILSEREQFLARVCRAIAQRRTLEPSGTLDQHPKRRRASI